MIIKAFSSDGVRIHAQVKWENAGRRDLELFVHGNKKLTADANAFLILCFLPAWRAGEERILIEDGAICPVLRANLAAVSQTIRRWYQFPDPPHIEAVYATRKPARGVGLFVSGGIDSLASLQWNLEKIPKSHPEAISEIILVAGTSGQEKFARLNQNHKVIARDAGVIPFSIRTNAQELHRNNMDFYMNVYHGAFLAGLAHCLGRRLRKVKVASSFDASNLRPWGSHPLLDPYYSGAHMTIEHNGLEMSRFAKTAIVAARPELLRHVNVCTASEAVGENCGRCEKCLRTMLGLIALGKLAVAPSFPSRDLQAKDLSDLTIRNVNYYLDLLTPLRKQGRSDLADALVCKLAGPPPLELLAQKARSGWQPVKRFLKRGYLGRQSRHYEQPHIPTSTWALHTDAHKSSNETNIPFE